MTIIDPCIAATSAPASIANVTRNLSKLNLPINVPPSVIGPYASVCFFSIAMTVTKDITPDTSPAMIFFTDKVNAPFTSLASSVVTISTSAYTPLNAGVYTVTLVYTWNGPSTTTIVFTVTVTDPCIAATVPPASIADVTRNLSDANLAINVPPAITGPYASVCFFSIAMTVTKSTSPDTSSAMILFTDMVDAPFTSLASSAATLITRIYVPVNAGIYTLTIVYSWSGGLSTAMRSFMVTIVDPCIAATSAPASIANVTRNLSD